MKRIAGKPPSIISKNKASPRQSLISRKLLTKYLELTRSIKELEKQIKEINKELKDTN